MEKSKDNGSFKETLKTIFYAVIVALFIRTVAFEPFNIPSGSMIPTLLVGDYLFVSKYTYGYSRHSLPYSLKLFKGRIFFSEPKRGDVVVFKLPQDNKTDYIKRVIGLPGDEIQMKNGLLYINGEEVKRTPVDEYVARDARGNAKRFSQYIETLPGGKEHKIIEIGNNEPFDNTSVFKVPDGHYFMMGDNRDNSTDSRSLVGFVPKVNLEGKAQFLFYSNDGSAKIWEVWKWPMSIRWERLFSKIE
ncbi:MAG: signal peptidase I [Alphaproteobacteria bacterium]